MNKKKLFRIFIIFTIIVLCIGITNRSFQNDTFYIIKLGESIFNNGIDMVDHFCFIGGLSYTYPHWLYDVFIYFIYNIGGFNFIYICNIILFIILVFSIYYISLKLIKEEFISGLNSILSIFLLNSFVTARSQLVSMILFIWEVYFIIGILKSGKKRYCVYLLFICLLLANIHATIWPMYFILYLPFIFEEFIYFLKGKLLKKKGSKVKLGLDGVVSKLEICHSKYFKLLIITLIISIFVGLLSPSKICYTYVFKIMQGDSQSYIKEHLPLDIYRGFPLLFLIGLWGLVLCCTKVKVRLSYVCMIVGLMIMAMISNRHLSLFYLIAVLFIFDTCSDFMIMSKDKTLDILVNIMCNKYIYIIMFIMIILVGVVLFNNNNSSYDYVDKKEYPVEAVKYIKNNLEYDNIRIFNDYNFGSYLLFNDIPVFIDSRSDLYMKQFNDFEYDIFNDFVDIIYDYEEKFKYYDIDYVLEYTTDELSLILYKDSNYEVIYEDDYFVLFKKCVI